MKALVYHGNRDLRLQDWPDPNPGPGEALLRVDYCGICATDIEEYLYGPAFIAWEEPNQVTGKKMPMVTGHEITATVMEVNGSDIDVAPGDRVAINGVLTCGTCYWCVKGRTDPVPWDGSGRIRDRWRAGREAGLAVGPAGQDSRRPFERGSCTHGTDFSRHSCGQTKWGEAGVTRSWCWELAPWDFLRCRRPSLSVRPSTPWTRAR